MAQVKFGNQWVMHEAVELGHGVWRHYGLLERPDGCHRVGSGYSDSMTKAPTEWYYRSDWMPYAQAHAILEEQYRKALEIAGKEKDK